MVKTTIVDGQLLTALNMSEVNLVIHLLEDLTYLKIKNKISITEEETLFLEELKATPSHAITHRNN